MSEKMTAEGTFGTIHRLLGEWCLKILAKDVKDISPQEIDKILKFLEKNGIAGTREGIAGEIESKLNSKFTPPHLPDIEEAIADERAV